MAVMVDRLLALGRWRWTPFVGLTAGSATFVATLTWVVPDRIGGAAMEASMRRPIPELGTTPLDDEEVESSAERATRPPSAPARSASRPTRTTSRERRRGFSPVVRPDEPPPEAANEPPPPAQQVVTTDMVEESEDESGQAAASRAARRAALRASTLASRAGARRFAAEQGSSVDEAPANDTAEGEPPPGDSEEPAEE